MIKASLSKLLVIVFTTIFISCENIASDIFTNSIVDILNPSDIGWRVEPCSMTINDSQGYYQDVLLEADSVYYRDYYPSSVRRPIKNIEVVDNGATVDTIRHYFYEFTFAQNCSYTSQNIDDIELTLNFVLRSWEPFELGKEYTFEDKYDYFHKEGPLDSDLSVTITHPDGESVYSDNYDKDILLRLASTGNTKGGFMTLDGEFEFTLTNREDPTDILHITNGTFSNVAFDGNPDYVLLPNNGK